jgi:flagellar protein FlaI
MNSAIQIQKVELPQKKQGLSFGRRVREIWEIEDFEKYREVTTWDPTTDTFVTKFENSVLLRRIASVKGLTMDEILLELAMRELYLREVVKSGVRDQRQVTSKILGYRLEQRTKNDASPQKKNAQKPPQNSPPEMAQIKTKSSKQHNHASEEHNQIVKDE